MCSTTLSHLRVVREKAQLVETCPGARGREGNRGSVRQYLIVRTRTDVAELEVPEVEERGSRGGVSSSNHRSAGT